MGINRIFKRKDKKDGLKSMSLPSGSKKRLRKKLKKQQELKEQIKKVRAEALIKQSEVKEVEV
jgi:hypothetical protein